MNTVVPYLPEHLLQIDLQEGQDYCKAGLTDRVARSLVGPYSYTFLRDGKPVAVMGLLELWKNRALAWSFVGKDAGPCFPLMTKIGLKALEMAPFRRIEADTPCEFEEGHRWLKLLGFKLEAECMEAYLPHGGNSSLYAKVKHG